MASKIKLDRKGRVVETEAQIQARIVDWLEARGFMVHKNRSGKMNALASRMTGGDKSERGSPDLFVWGEGKPHKRLGERIGEDFATITIPTHFAVEVKRPGGKPSQAQLDWAGRFCELGHLYILCSSHEEVEKALRERGYL